MAQTQLPIRAESPRIPSGGIDAVATRASTNFVVAATKLELEAVQAEYDGFASARGMDARTLKRGSEEGG
jgi:DNA repair and recombination protein RAD52